MASRAPRLAAERLGRGDLERAVERLLGTREVTQPHADLAQRRQRDTHAVRRAGLLLQGDAALGQRQGLLVTVLHERHVGLVAAHGRHHIVGARGRREALGLPEGGHALVVPAVLRQHDAGHRMHLRQGPAVARRVQRRGGF